MTPGDGSKDRASILDSNEPITLSDPDGAITRVAPWSTWTREQVRAPGGEPSLVTHLQDGQLWFASGRARSPWNHEVRVGDVAVSTPQGRFHVVVAEGGGVTVSCLAGRARIRPKDGEPTVIGENETAAVSGDGRDVVVTKAEARSADDPAGGAPEEPGPASDAAAGALLPVHVPGPRRNLGGIARIAAVVAIVAVAAAALALLLRDGGDDERGSAGPVVTAGPVAASTSTTAAPTTTETPATTEAATTTEAPATTEAPTVTVPTVRSSPDAVAAGTLVACRRSPDGVVATVDVRHTSGGAGRFRVEIGLVNTGGRTVATGRATSGLIADGQVVPVEVEVATDGIVRGACELVAVEPV